MKFATTSLSLVLASLALVAAAPGFEKRAPGVVGISIYKNGTDTDALKRRSTFISPEGITNDINEGSYLFDFELGTPPQQLTAAIDTGSSDLIVFSTVSAGAPSGTTLYNYLASSTRKLLKPLVYFGYGSGGAYGTWNSDTLTLNGGEVKIPAYQFSDIGYGSTGNIFGIGYDSNEAQASTYSNLPALLKTQGYTAANAYSLYLDDVNATTGSILFGGVDSAKYTGPLVTLPIEYQDDEGDKTTVPTAFFVNITSVSGSTKGSTSVLSTGNTTALLDSGTTETLFISKALADSIATEFGFTTDSSGNYVKPLKDIYADTTSTIDYKFADNLTIKVPIGQAVVPDTDDTGKPIVDSNGNALGVLLVSSFSVNILGDSFLRNAYVVYDLDNAQVALAQAKFDTTDSNIVAITSAGIPGAVPAN